MTNFFIRPTQKSTHIKLLATFLALSLTACQSVNPNAQSAAQSAKKTPNIALVLGGGGAKGFAHIGVIKALEENGIHPTLIVGTSLGAMVGAVYASGKSASELASIALSVSEQDLLDIAPSKQGLIEGQALADFINRQVNQKPIERLPIAFAAVATEAKTGQAVYFRQGDTGQAVRASASVPNLFVAPRLPKNGKKYIDGGRSALVPARIARTLNADVVIAVDIMADKATTPQQTQANRASISRSETGFNAKFGNQSVNIPFNINDIKSQSLPFGLGDGIASVIDSLPSEISINLPKELPTNPSELKDRLNAIGSRATADPADIRASDVVIRPKVGQYAVFETSQTARHEMMDAGYRAAMLEIDNIKFAINQASNQLNQQ